MPIGSQARSRPLATAPLTNSSTGFVANRPKPKNEPLVVVPDSDNDNALPSYAESDDQVNDPKKLLRPSSDHDLEYFEAVASKRPVRAPCYSDRLVLHFYRNTQSHIFPVEERMTLGSSLKTPFYVLKASPSVTSADEYNKLTITRWQPSTGVRHYAASAEILPRLKLLAKGSMEISKLFLSGMPNGYELWWDSERETYTVWQNQNPELEVYCVNWVSLEDKPQKGKLVIMSIVPDEEEKATQLAVLDFNKPSPQFYCSSKAGQKKLDLIVISLMTVATVHTRRPALMSQTLTSHGLQIQDVSNITYIKQKQNARIKVVV